MIKFKAACAASTGKLLDMKSALCGGVTLQAAIEAIGNIVARLVHHVVVVHSDKVTPEKLIAEITSKVNEVYPTLPEITKEMSEAAVKCNEEADPEPEYRSVPSADDHQVLSGGMSLRAGGFEVFQGGANTDLVPFDELPLAAAGLLGAIVAHGLTGLVAPARGAASEDDVMSTFKAALMMNLPLGEVQRRAMVAMTYQRRMTKFIHGDIGREEN